MRLVFAILNFHCAIRIVETQHFESMQDVLGCIVACGTDLFTRLYE